MSDVAAELRRHPRWVTLNVYPVSFEHRTPEGVLFVDGFLPDLTDDATAGWLLGIVAAEARATGRSGPHIVGPAKLEPGWGIEVGEDDRGPLIIGSTGSTLGEAAARVLLALWADAK